MANLRTVKLKPDTFALVKKMQDELKNKDRNNINTKDAVIHRAIKWWLYDDIDYKEGDKR